MFPKARHAIAVVMLRIFVNQLIKVSLYSTICIIYLHVYVLLEWKLVLIFIVVCWSAWNMLIVQGESVTTASFLRTLRWRLSHVWVKLDFLLSTAVCSQKMPHHFLA